MIHINRNLLKYLGMSCYSCVKKGNKLNCISLNLPDQESVDIWSRNSIVLSQVGEIYL